MQFSDATNKTGIAEQIRSLVKLDANQWPTYKIVNSCNNYLDVLTGFAIGADRRFQWDDTNHTKLPEGTTALTANQSDFSFLTDEQGNRILTLLGISRLDAASGKYIPLELVDRNDPTVDLSTFGTQTGTPTQYDQIADNIIRLNYMSSSTVTAGIKFFFQRTASYFAATDTTKEPGVAIPLHRGFVINGAFDAALSEGLPTLAALGNERLVEEAKMKRYFGDRNQNTVRRLVPRRESNK